MSPVFETGDVVAGVYEIRGELGAGSMGEVYDARDRALNRRVALKVARPNVAADYLLREGRALAAIHHPGVVTVYAIGEHKGVPFLALERVYGLSLDRIIEARRARGERFPIGEAVELLLDTADTLNVVHRAGLAHRDIKPANIMLAPGGRVVIMDFGLVLHEADRAGYQSAAGSLQYMAPEAFTREVAEGETALLDVYSVGVLAYELLSGITPFDGGNARELHEAKVRPQMPRVAKRRPDVPAALDELVAQMISPNPQDRPAGAEALLWQLRSLRERLGAGGEVRAFSVLIVDDDDDTRRALALYVRAAAPDAEIETAGEGRQAVRSVRRRVPDLLLVDLDLPDINGIEVCMLLRGMQLGDACQIVSVSARASRADVELLQQLGVRSLEKGPGLMPQLAELIERMRASR